MLLGCNHCKGCNFILSNKIGPVAKTKSGRVTPLMQQYNGIKAKYPDAILLFRVGDFYETFGEDAVTVARVLGITLTKRANGAASHIALAGFPHHSLDTYLPRLVKAGFRAAICDQLEDPKKTKKIVKRGVTELVTPGVAFSDKLLDHRSNNFLASVFFHERRAGVAFLDASTGEFLVGEGSIDYIDKLLQSFQPAEVLFARDQQKDFTEAFGNKWFTYHLDEWVFNTDYAQEILLRQFGTKSLKGFGIYDLTAAVIAAGSAVHYLDATEHKRLQHITAISRIAEDRYVWLDKFTIRNLELIYSPHESGVPLVKIMDKTISPMGARLMKKWIVLPLKDQIAIRERLDLVEYLMEQKELSEATCTQIQSIGDLERLIARIPMKKIGPREVIQLARSLLAIAPVKVACAESSNSHLNKIAEQLNPCVGMTNRIVQTLVDEPPALVHKGQVIREGVDSELDEYRSISQNAKQHLEKIRLREVEATGISSLKVGFNNVFGYYLEVTNRYKDIVPEVWIRKQTLTNAERYITEELKEYERKILEADEKIGLLEYRLYEELVEFMMDYIQPVQLNAALIARLDCLLSFARTAEDLNYCKPEINDSLVIDIKQGRHPVIEQQLELGEDFVPNDVLLDSEGTQIIILTGPNMSGKSALLRQTALIVLMAQMGSFVPAVSAKLGLTDRVFTRVGASDNISSGESTFMVEMNETASIMNNLSSRSLILLDEIGRGTSTYDGISIAWSLAEYLHDHPTAKAKTLFATHYHELNELEERLERARNFHIATREVGKKVLFLRKLVPGGSEHSFGIHVAQMAGMPNKIVERAASILSELEQKSIDQSLKGKVKEIPKQEYQLNLFSMDNPKLNEMKEKLDFIDINRLTPIEALLKLKELKEFIAKE